ncbi:MAG: hypothetical protein JST09_15575 [Bacteroidetes bacterium]|nr:hypothetical protein [Bacteroidota bacterium]
MKVSFILFGLLLSLQASTQIHTKQPLPDSTTFKTKIIGNIKKFIRWTDRFGDNYLILTETNKIASPANITKSKVDCGNGCTNKELYAYHFAGNDSLIWKLNDFIKNCNFDNIVEFRDEATKITDLDKNGIAEIWLMYSMTCTNDISPRTLKLIMYQGNKKYAIRGTSQTVKQKTDEKLGNKYVPDKEFQTLPHPFKDFARNLWTQYLYDVR